MAEDFDFENFDEERSFDDRAPDDGKVGPAHRVWIKGRCTNCWGPIQGLRDQNADSWKHIECRICGREFRDQDAKEEAHRMLQEVEDNIPQARIGRSARYRKNAKFVLKIFPDMDRDIARFSQRVASAKTPSKCIGRETYPSGDPGYLYAQACMLVSGLSNLPREMSAISLSDFDFGEPQIQGVAAPDAEGKYKISGTMPVVHRRPSRAERRERMGTAMIAGMTAAFAYEIGIKAILLTRLDHARKSHDLYKLFGALPADSQERLNGDFASIDLVLKKHRHTFAAWRYFEKSKDGKEAMLGLVNTERVHDLAKAARVIVDECYLSGLDYEIYVKSDFKIPVGSLGPSYSEHVKLDVIGHECAFAWDDILDGTQ